MRKKIVLFFSLFLLTLTLVPCTDLHTEENVITFSFDQAQEDHEEHHDICPPFCSCNCCSSSAICQLIDSYSEIETNIPESSNTYQSEYFYNYYPGIWQPPKIS